MKQIEVVKVASGYIVNVSTARLGFMPIRSFTEDIPDELNLACATNFANDLAKHIALPVVKY